NEPVDLTDQGFVTGNSDRYAGGVTAPSGTSTTAVRSPYATPGGVPGGTGTRPPAPPPPRDLSRDAMPDVQRGWDDCGFPPEADIEGINLAVVMLAATVTRHRRRESVGVVKDAAYGFGC